MSPTPNSCDSTTICTEFAYVLEDDIKHLDDCMDPLATGVKTHLRPGTLTNNCLGSP